jgi:hypothetical protein
MSIAAHLLALDGRLDRLDAKVDERFEQIDRRFEQVDVRFDEQRAHTNALFEASRGDFNNLYDFVRAQAERTDARFEQIQTEFRTRFADLHTAITALTPRRRRSGGRRRG